MTSSERTGPPDEALDAVYARADTLVRQRQRRGRLSMLAGSVVVVALLGGLSVASWKQERVVTSSEGATPPTGVRVEGETGRPVANQDHWHTAYGVWICGEFVPAIQDQRDPVGIHTHGDGIIHVHPFVRKASGTRATLEVFLDAVGARAGNETLSVPGYGLWHNGADSCRGTPAEVHVVVYASTGQTIGVFRDAADVRLRDGEGVNLVFDAPGASIPAPPMLEALPRLNPETEQVEPAGR